MFKFQENNTWYMESINKKTKRNYFATTNISECIVDQESLLALVKEWDFLSLDNYMRDGGKYRLRRYGVFYLLTDKMILEYQGVKSFKQSKEANPENGGIDRYFAELKDSTYNNSALKEIILHDFKALPFQYTNRKNFHVGVHQVRILAQAGGVGMPTPEGIHRDEELFTAQHLIRRQNISGGVNYIYGSDDHPACTPKLIWQQEELLDSFYFDRNTWHSVSPIKQNNDTILGIRDVLLLDFDFL